MMDRPPYMQIKWMPSGKVQSWFSIVTHQDNRITHERALAATCMPTISPSVGAFITANSRMAHGSLR